jgi:hypothetical protein
MTEQEEWFHLSCCDRYAIHAIRCPKALPATLTETRCEHCRCIFPLSPPVFYDPASAPYPETPQHDCPLAPRMQDA